MGLLPIEEALRILLSDADPIAETESIPIGEGGGRILAEEVVSPLDVPPEDNSEMDGYALSVSSGGTDAGATLPVSDRIPAGYVGKPLAAGTAARIFTGAGIPDGADAVIMQENVDDEGDHIVLQSTPRPGDHIRPRGQDIRRGQQLLQTGSRLGAAEIGLLASIGISLVPVRRRLKIAVMSTGDELIMPGEELTRGKIYNSNQFLLRQLIEGFGMEHLDFGRVADDLDATTAALEEAAAACDCVVSTGGVSVGEEDHVKAAVEQLGELTVWRIAIKPGKPLAFGRVKGVPFFGLPGNPVSAYVTFCILARPYLMKVQGARDIHPASTLIPADFDYEVGTRDEFLRVQIQRDEDGGQRAAMFPNQGSAILSSISWAHGLGLVRQNTTISRGDRIEVIMLRDFFC